MLDNLRIAIVHDWLITYGGAERVLAHILKLYPHADLFALYDFLDDTARGQLQNRKAKTSFLQKLPRARTRYRSYLPLMPYAVEQFDLNAYDLVISSSHAVARGALTGADQLHISYTNNTMIYAWDMYHHYLRGAGLNGGLRGAFAKSVLHYVRTWDAASAHRVDSFIANSHHTARRLKKQYGRDATVIYPPVDIDRFEVSDAKDDYFVTVSRLVPFKRIDLIIDAFASLPQKKLVVVGDGPEMKSLRRRAGSNIEFVGFLTPDKTANKISRARALIFASVEPFGLVLVEAQACGTPVIAFRRGGAGEIITHQSCGILFDQQTPAAIVESIRAFEQNRDRFEVAAMTRNANRFSPDAFHDQFSTFVAHEYESFLTKSGMREEEQLPFSNGN
jgi:glycosyltransferase involved in cell wall biosynthesis